MEPVPPASSTGPGSVLRYRGACDSLWVSGGTNV